MPTTRLRLLPGRRLRPCCCAALASAAHAHPHVWVTVEATVLHGQGGFVGLSYKWTFDEAYTATAIEGLDKNKDGIYDRKELAELAKVNIDGLKEFAFFTHAFLGGRKLATGEASDYWLEHKGGLLSLHFTLPFATPVPSRGQGLRLHHPRSGILRRLELAGEEPCEAGCRGAERVQGQGGRARAEARRRLRAGGAAGADGRLRRGPQGGLGDRAGP